MRYECQGSTKQLLGAAIMILLVIQTIRRYLLVNYGPEQMHWDAWAVWKPAAEAVLSGTPLYMGQAVDNKPPLFHFLNILVASTGRYHLAFLLVVAIGNLLIAVLLWKFLTRYELGEVGALGAILFVAALPFVNGNVINVRTFALVGILSALIVRQPTVSGFLLGCASLFTQYAIIALPVVLGIRLYETTEGDHLRRGLMFIGSGLASVVTTFVIVCGVWGLDSVQNGLQMTYWGAPDYVSRGGVPSSVDSPLIWVGEIYFIVVELGFILVPAGIAVARLCYGRVYLNERNMTMDLVAVLAVLFSLPLAVRAYHFYWILPLPFMAVLAALALGYLFKSHHEILGTTRS